MMDIGQFSGVKSGQRVDQAPAPVSAPLPAAAAKAAPVIGTNAVQQPSSAQLAEAMRNINKALESMSSELEFTVDNDTKATVVKVIDRQTKEVIRQIPNEETLEISKALDKLQGLLIRQKA
jgi:flagellar protein FlaG